MLFNYESQKNTPQLMPIQRRCLPAGLLGFLKNHFPGEGGREREVWACLGYWPLRADSKYTEDGWIVSIWLVCVWFLIRLSSGSPVRICIGFSQFAPSHLLWPNYPHVFRLCLIVCSTSLWYLRSCFVRLSGVLLLPVDPLWKPVICTGNSGYYRRSESFICWIVSVL